MKTYENKNKIILENRKENFLNDIQLFDDFNQIKYSKYMYQIVYNKQNKNDFSTYSNMYIKFENNDRIHLYGNCDTILYVSDNGEKEEYIHLLICNEKAKFIVNLFK